MLYHYETLKMSSYIGLYEKIIPKDNLLRRIKEIVSFEFVYEELENNYSKINGRKAYNPILMFKYLLLKAMYNLSDKDLVERSRYDMSFKYFLGLLPEEEVIEASSLTKFRKQKLKGIEILDMLINKSVEIAIEKGVIKSGTVIVDATHTRSRYNKKNPVEILKETSKALRKSVYKVNETKKSEFPKKPTRSDLEEEIKYSEELIKVIKKDEELKAYKDIQERLNLLEEIVTDDLEEISQIKEQEAKVGHKTADSAFFGFKTHIVMTDERIITGAIITSGEKTDGKELIELLEKTKKAGIKVTEVIGDTAYSEKKNIQYTEEQEIKLISKLHPIITNNTRKNEFEFNKDAGMFVCTAGHMAKRKRKNKRGEIRNPTITYYFDIKKCKSCKYKEGCYKEGAKSKSYSVSIRSTEHEKQKAFQETEYFKERMKNRYKIEAKNGELKTRHGYDVASSSGIRSMEIQGATAIFAANLKRIIKLIWGEK